ncbi:MAG: quinone oxidoreductase [Desulfosarcinaceae bacterium]|nr:quinone oxidoreductase [Desulfosarcinaceae bacterium]
MNQAIRIHATGGPEAMVWESVPLDSPGPGEVLVRHEAIGLNFIDVYHRTGLYPLPQLPAVLGLEAAGEIEALAEDVTDLAVGDRVAYAGAPAGAYSQRRCIPAHRLVKLPDDIDYPHAAAMMLKGMTARYLLRGCFPVSAGDTILIHAAAGGVGTLVCQWARHLGATVIGTVGSPQKADLAAAAGCHFPIDYVREDFQRRALEITDGRGVDVVYDSVGQATFDKSLACLRPFGTLVSFGQSSGSVPPFDLGRLAAQGSVFLTRPSLLTYTAERDDLLAHAADLFNVVSEGVVKIGVNRTYPLKEAAQAHRDLEDRLTTGATILLP